MKLQKRSGEAGFSLLSILATMAILGAVLMTARTFFDNQFQARQKIKSQIANEDVDSALTRELTSHVLAALKSSGSCLTASSLSGQAILGSSNMEVTTNISVPGPDVPPKFRAAADRCRRQRNITNSNSPSDSKVYMCVKIRPDNTGGKNSFMTAKYIFAEVYLELRDLQTGGPLSCANFLSSRNSLKTGHHGAMAMIDLYWSHTAMKGAYNHNSQSYISYVSDR